MSENQDRRAYPRISDKNISLKLKSENFDSTISQSLNISASGVYCKIDKEIPLMSKVKIVLMLPNEKTKKPTKTSVLETQGIVVREHPVIENGQVKHYDVAIFFDNLSKKDQKKIQHYIQKEQQ